MGEVSKNWWESKTIWTQVIAMAFALGSGLKWWPQDLDQTQVMAAVMGVVGVITIVFRFMTHKPIAQGTSAT